MTSDNDRLTGMDGGDFSGLVLRDLAINQLFSSMTLVYKLQHCLPSDVGVDNGSSITRYTC